MPNKKYGNFTGFFPETIDFLRNLRINNDKIWFEANRDNYEKCLLNPIRNLVVDISEFMLTIDPYFEIRPNINKTISKIYRDVRFSKNKAPYRSRMWMKFIRADKNWHTIPGYFFEINTDSYLYGMGFYAASRDTMDNLRKLIDEKSKIFLRANSLYSKQKIFSLEGEKYKRIIDKSKTEEIQNWYQRKNLYFICTKKIDKRLFSRGLIEDLISDFNLLAHFYNFFWEIRLMKS